MPHGISITWCGAPARTAELADFFARHVGPDYISHAELQGGRALSPSQWRPTLRDAMRGRGVGKALLDWIAAEARARGIRRLFLEGGVGNEREHDFFERGGFRPTSVVMIKELD